MNYIIGVDPGTKQHAVAAVLRGELCALDVVNTDALRAALVGPYGVNTVVIELPQVYTAAKQKGDPNDLIRLAYHAGRLSLAYDNLDDCEVETISPREWKGTIAKEIMTKRILSKLEPSELDILNRACADFKIPPSKHHNLIDAIGIAFWKAGRL